MAGFGRRLAVAGIAVALVWMPAAAFAEDAPDYPAPEPEETPKEVVVEEEVVEIVEVESAPQKPVVYTETVVADEAVLAETGFDGTVMAIGAGALLVAGAATLVVAGRRTTADKH